MNTRCKHLVHTGNKYVPLEIIGNRRSTENPTLGIMMYSRLSLLRYCWAKKKVLTYREYSHIQFKFRLYFLAAGILKIVSNKQYIHISEFVIARDYCTAIYDILF